MVCTSADEAAQMLLLTARDLSNAVDTRPWYIVAEHMMPRYEAAVAAIVLDNKSETKNWSVAVGEAHTFWEMCTSVQLQEVLRCSPLPAAAHMAQSLQGGA